MVRTLRLGAVLLPAALLLHEIAYSIAGGGMIGAHHYLEVVVPLAFALAASLACAALVMPALGRPGRGPQPYAPFALAGALLAIFVCQELAEATVLGGGMRGLAASLAVSWLAPPLALVLGAIAAGIAVVFDRAGNRIAARFAARRRRLRPARARRVPPRDPRLEHRPSTCLAFGFARRPPPLRV
jgi:hypothetical protein